MSQPLRFMATEDASLTREMQSAFEHHYVLVLENYLAKNQTGKRGSVEQLRAEPVRGFH